MPKRSRESEGGGEAGSAGTLAVVSKKKRDSTGGGGAGAEGTAAAAAAAAASSKKGRSSLGGGGKQLQPMLLPGTLPARLKEGQELVLLRYPAAFDLGRLQGCALPAALLGGALGGGHALALPGGGAARLTAAPRSVASQGLFVAAVGAAAEGGGGAEGGEAEEAAAAAAAPSVRLLPTPAALVLDLTLAPQQAPPLAGLRSVVLTKRAPVPRAAPSRP